MLAGTDDAIAYFPHEKEKVVYKSYVKSDAAISPVNEKKGHPRVAFCFRLLLTSEQERPYRVLTLPVHRQQCQFSKPSATD